MAARIPIFLLLLLQALQSSPGSMLEGRLVDDLTGAAVPRVRYTLSGANLRDPTAGFSDAQGVFQIPNLQAGRYRLSFEKAGYFTLAYGEFEVLGPQTKLGGILVITKRFITGSVRWQDGEGAARAQVIVFGVRRGKMFARPDIPMTTTNDRGDFEVKNLEPGSYVLYVSPPGPRTELNSSAQPTSVMAARLALPVLHPTTLDLSRSADASDIAITLDEKPGTEIEGTILPSVLFPVGSAVTLRLTLNGNPGPFAISASARVGEPFRIASVPEGSYLLEARAQAGDSSVARGLQSVFVSREGLRGVTVALPDPAVIAGRIESADLKDGARVRAQSQRLASGGEVLNATFTADGAFQISNVVPGEVYDLSVASLPAGTYIDTVMPFPVTAGGEPVHIVLKDDGGRIQGLVKNGVEPARRAFVVLAPLDRLLEHRYQTVLSSEAGSFELTDVPPGDYDLFAFDRANDDYLEDSFLRTFERNAIPIEVLPRANQSVELQVVSAVR